MAEIDNRSIGELMELGRKRGMISDYVRKHGGYDWFGDGTTGKWDIHIEDEDRVEETYQKLFGQQVSPVIEHSEKSPKSPDPKPVAIPAASEVTKPKQKLRNCVPPPPAVEEGDLFARLGWDDEDDAGSSADAPGSAPDGQQARDGGMDGQTALFYVLATLTVLLLIYAFGGLILLALPWIGLKAMLG